MRKRGRLFEGLQKVCVALHGQVGSEEGVGVEDRGAPVRGARLFSALGFKISCFAPRLGFLGWGNVTTKGTW